MKKFLIMVLVLLFIIMAAVLLTYIFCVEAAELHVDPNGVTPDGDLCYESIQDAIDVAVDSDVVVVQPGTYKENINFYKKAITIKSTDPNDPDIVSKTIIDGNNTQPVVYFVSGEGSSSVLAGLTLRKGNTASYGGGIFCRNSSPSITNCIICGNTAGSNGGGIYCYLASPSITNCTIKENYAGSNGGGIFCDNFSSPSITSCTINGNEKIGIYCDNSSSPTITDCIINGYQGDGIYCRSSAPVISGCDINNNEGIGIFFDDCSSATITECTITANYGGGISCNNSSSPAITGCTISDNKSGSYTNYQGVTSKSIAGGIRCQTSSSPHITECMISRNVNGGISCDSSSLPTISRCTINDNKGASFGGGISCLGGSSPSITDCVIKGNSSKSSGGGIYCAGSTTVTRCEVNGCTASTGGGIYCVGTAVVNNCTINGNKTSKGGSVYCSESAIVYDCIISGNNSYGISADGMASVIACTINENQYVGVSTWGNSSIIDCTIKKNKGNGINAGNSSIRNCIIRKNNGSGIYSSCSSPSICGCVISENNNSGIYCVCTIGCDKPSTPTVSNCSIFGNFGRSGGGVYIESSSLTINNCVISGNKARQGCGGIYLIKGIFPSLCRVTNCTISGNIGGIYNKRSSLNVTNSILAYNYSQEIHEYVYNSNTTVTYSNILQKEGIYPGEGNINADPLFMESEVNNYYLSPNSPCIDIGDPNNAPLEDKEGILRSQGGGIDMGAYEYVDPDSCTPRALFTADKTSGVDNLTVTFDAVSSGGSQYNGALYSWNFGDGTGEVDSNVPNVSHTYTQYGSYDVGLTITTDCGSHSYTLYNLIKISSSQVTKEVIKIDSSQVTEEVEDGYFYTTIQGAIDDAKYGEVILVHDGTYFENIDFKRKGISLLSENGAENTIIDGNGSGRVVIFDQIEGKVAVLDGFTIQNGKCGYYENGGGIHAEYSSPKIINCIIRENKNDGNGGRYGGGINCHFSSAIITNCKIVGNSSGYGGGICCNNSSLIISSCIMSENTAISSSHRGGYGGGIYCAGSSPVIINCIISKNTATYSEIWRYSMPDLSGGGIYCSTSSPSIINCTITDNQADSGSGGIACSGSSSPTIKNCIFWNNIPMEIKGTLKITYSNIYGGYEGEGNINTDPIFVGSEAGNYYLSSNSPCIDMGDPNNTPLEDNEGILRPQGAGIDIGAYEYVEPNSCIPRASFTADVTVGTPPLEVMFDASSSGGSGYEGALFQWDFGDGTSGSGLNVSHTYKDPNFSGFRDVGLTIITDCGSHKIRLHDFIKIKPIQFLEVGEGYAYTTIQGAIDDAKDWQTIFVHDGIYYENINFMGKPIMVCSENGADSTIIDGNANGSVVTFNHREDPDTVLEGFTLRNGLNSIYIGGGGIYFAHSSPCIKNCVIIKNTSENGGGIYCGPCSSPNITNCTISNNSVTHGGAACQGGGICCIFSSPSITNCIISNNFSKYRGGGIYCFSSSPVITNCNIIANLALGSSTNSYTEGVYSERSSPIITNCILWNIGGEIFGSASVTYSNIKGGYPGEGNINVDPLFIGSEDGNFYLRINSPCIDSGTITGAPSEDKEGISRPQGVGVDMGVYEYVEPISNIPRASFTADKPIGIDPLTVEFDGSSSGGSRYNGTVFLWDFGDGTSGNGLKVSHTYTDPNFYGLHDVSLTVTTDQGSHTLTIYDFVIVKPSNPTRQVGKDFYYDSIQEAIDDADNGEMILVHDGTYVENINFKGKTIILYSKNGAESTIIDGSAGGNVVTFDQGEDKHSILDGFTIQNGLSGRGIYCYNSSPLITNCLVRKNSSGGIYCRHTFYPPHIIDCTILENSGSGISCLYSSPVIKKCSIKGNKAGAGGGVYCEYSSPCIVNCLISQNLAAYMGGGGIYCKYSSPNIINCTVSHNAAVHASGIYFKYSYPTIRNSIIWGNLRTQLSNSVSNCNSSPTILYSNIEGGYAGEGNINLDPLFVGSEAGNYYLNPNSPCIDASDSLGAPLEDREGIPRPQGAGIDMGAYEFIEPDSCLPRASYRANVVTGTNPLTVEFDASSSGGSQFCDAHFSWNFGDGSINETDSNTVSHTYLNYGSYDVSLTVTNDYGSHTLTLYDFIKIKSALPTKEVGEGYEYSSIQAAIEAVSEDYGEVILVHDGTYFENINFKGRRITVCSENGPNNTIIDGGANGSVITFNHREDKDSVLEGITIQNGLASKGGGIYCWFSSPSITNCIIRENTGDSYGGGIFCEDSLSLLVNNCTIIENKVNLNGGGGICSRHSFPNITNCVFRDNSSNSGGGIVAYWGSPSITNCTFYENSGGDGGAIYNMCSTSKLRNCIFWNNPPNEIYYWLRSVNCSLPSVSYSNIQGGWYRGTGNIDADPLFVDPNSGDFHLKEGSPCIDSGTNENAPTMDRDGVSRPQGSICDMGAYEYVDPSCADDTQPPEPDINPLPDLIMECSAPLTPPTAADSCAGVVTAVTNDPLMYDTKGTYEVTWIYDDGKGNTATQQQTVIIMGIDYYEDADGDGYGNPNSITRECTALPGYVENYEDCDDNDPNSYPNAIEICDDLDNDCDGKVDELPECSDPIVEPGFKGDLNQSQTITSADAIIILQIAVGLRTPDEYQLWAGDLNNDGRINSADAILVLKAAVKMPTIFYVNPISGLPDDTVNIIGWNFNDTQDDSVVFFGDIPAEPISWSDNEIITTVPSEIEHGPVYISIDTVGGLSNLCGYTVEQDQMSRHKSYYPLFRIEESIRTISIPSDIIASSCEQVIIPVEIDDAAGIAGMDLILGFDSDVLIPVDVECASLTQGFLLGMNKELEGRLVVALASAMGITEGSGALLNLIFKVSPEAKEPDSSSLIIHSVKMYDKDINPIEPITSIDGQFSVQGEGCDCIVERELTGKWNMVSLPVGLENTLASAIFSDAEVIYSFIKGYGYVRVKANEKMEPGVGYWVLLPEAEGYNLLGDCIQKYTLPVENGWYLIGSCSTPAQAYVDNGSIDVIYLFDPKYGYRRVFETEKLEPGLGYWILLSNISDQATLKVEGQHE